MLQSLLTLLVHRVKSGSRHLVCGTLSINVILSRLQQNNCTNSTASKQRLLTAAATLMLDSNLSTAPIHIHITEFHCLFISVYPTLFILITFCILCTAVHPLQVVAVMFVTKVMPHCSKKCPTLWAVRARLSVSMCDIKKCLWLQQTHGGQVPACTCTCMNQHVSVPVYTCTTMYMHVPVCTCTCVYLYLCIPVPLCTCMYLHQCVSVPVYTCTTVYMCVPTPVCICTRVYLYYCVHVCTCACMYLHLAMVFIEKWFLVTSKVQVLLLKLDDVRLGDPDVFFHQRGGRLQTFQLLLQVCHRRTDNQHSSDLQFSF